MEQAALTATGWWRWRAEGAPRGCRRSERDEARTRREAVGGGDASGVIIASTPCSLHGIAEIYRHAMVPAVGGRGGRARALPVDMASTCVPRHARIVRDLCCRTDSDSNKSLSSACCTVSCVNDVRCAFKRRNGMGGNELRVFVIKIGVGVKQ